jgi:hypothetical protein
MELNLATLEAAAASFYAGADARSRAEAEQYLAQLNASSAPWAFCQHVLDASRSEYAHFAVVSAMRASAIRARFSPGDASSRQLREYLCSFVVGRHASLARGVQNLIWALVAVLFKMEFTAEVDCMDSVLVPIRDMLSSGSECKELCMSLIFAMISEFSARSASALGLSWEQQVGIHRKFERGALQPIFIMLVQTLQSSIGPDTRGSASLIGKCLANLVSVLDWEFDETIASNKLSWASIDRTSSIAMSASSTARPGSAWTALLVASDLVEFMSSVQARLEPSDQNSASLTRRCLIQLASIQGSVFPDTGSKCRYLVRLLAGTTLDQPTFCSFVISLFNAQFLRFDSFCHRNHLCGRGVGIGRHFKSRHFPVPANST